MLKLTQNCW